MTDNISHKLADIAAPIMERLGVSLGDSHHFSKEDSWLIISALHHYAKTLDESAMHVHYMHVPSAAATATLLEAKAQHCKDIADLIDLSPSLLVNRAMSETQ